MEAIVCEDDKEILDILKLLLEDMGINVITAKNVQEFEANLNSCNPKLVILDYWIRNVKADRLVDTLKKDEYYKHVPVILISATTNLEAIGKRLGVNDIITKPFDIDVFQTKVKKLITQNNREKNMYN